MKQQNRLKYKKERLEKTAALCSGSSVLGDLYETEGRSGNASCGAFEHRTQTDISNHAASSNLGITSCYGMFTPFHLIPLSLTYFHLIPPVIIHNY
jgi:hypothetical protein